MNKILYISPFSRIGGGEISILTVINSLDRTRFSPYLACYEDGPFVELAKSRGVETSVFRRAGFLSEFSVVRSLVRHIKNNSITLVHVNSLDIRAGIAARLAGVPCIGHLRVIFPFTWRDQLFVRLSAVTIAVSRAVVDEFVKSAPSYKSKFVILPNMVEVPPEVRPAPLRTEFSIPSGAPLVGMAGRMDPFKGHSVFIDSAAIIKKSVPEARFFIMGGASKDYKDEVSYLEAQKAHAKESGLINDVIFTGFRQDALSAIAALDVLVVPSRIIRKGDAIMTEGFGRVAIEAMAVGTPVVSSDAGGLPEIVNNGVTGIIVPMDDPPAAAAAVIELLRNRQKTDLIKTAAKKRFNELYSTKSVAKLQDLYCSILNKRYKAEK